MCKFICHFMCPTVDEEKCRNTLICFYWLNLFLNWWTIQYWNNCYVYQVKSYKNYKSTIIWKLLGTDILFIFYLIYLGHISFLSKGMKKSFTNRLFSKGITGRGFLISFFSWEHACGWKTFRRTFSKHEVLASNYLYRTSICFLSREHTHGFYFGDI